MQILEQFAASTRVIEGSALLMWSEEGTFEAQPLPKAGRWRILLLEKEQPARVVEGTLHTKDDLILIRTSEEEITGALKGFSLIVGGEW